MSTHMLPLPPPLSFGSYNQKHWLACNYMTISDLNKRRTQVCKHVFLPSTTSCCLDVKQAQSLARHPLEQDQRHCLVRKGEIALES